MKKNENMEFPFPTMRFLAKLEKNNNREWYTEHKEEYEIEFLIPAQNYVVELGDMMSRKLPGLHAVPKVDKSIFRLMRDVRFSKNKSPYKTNLGVFLWDGDVPRMDAPGLYTHIESGHCFLASGVYMFNKDYLTKYREAVVDPVAGKELAKAIKKVTADGTCQIGNKKYKKIPKGYDPEHPLAELLLHDSLHAFTREFKPSELSGVEFTEFAYKHFCTMLPVHNWLMKYLFT